MTKILRWTALAIVAFVVTACPSYKYKPYLPKEYRGPAGDPDGTAGGIFTGRKGEYVIYGR